MPTGNRDHWSYLGHVRTDTIETPVLLRREIPSTVYVSGRRTLRSSQRVVPSLSEALADVAYLNRTWYETTHNGWQIFREEVDGKVLEFERPARVLPDRFELGKSYKYKSILREDGGVFGVVSYHAVPLGIESVTIPNGTYEALKVNVEKRSKLASDEKLENVTSQVTEYASLWFVDAVGIVKQDVSVTTVTPDRSETLQYSLELAATNHLPNYLWPEAEVTSDGWTFVSWLGYLTDNHFPWIYHAEHGWLYVDAVDSSDVRLWSESLGWWFTSADLYPLFYSHDLGEWLSFEGRTRTERRFVRADGTVIAANDRGFISRARTGAPPSVQVGSDEAKDNSLTFVDADGNRYTNTGSGLQKDSGSAPEVVLLHPFSGVRVKEKERVLVLADAKDSDGEVVWVKLFANGNLLAVLEKPPYQAVLEADGSVEAYSLLAIARDNFGNETTSETVTLDVQINEKIAPKVRVASPLNKSWFSLGSKLWIELAASDSDGFVESVALVVDGVQVGEEKTRPPYLFEFTPPVSDAYQISGIAVDDDGNEATATPITIHVNYSGTPESEQNAPEVIVSSPLNGQSFASGSSIPIAVHASDVDGLVEQVQIFVNNQQIGPTLSRPPYQVTYYPPSGFSGSVTVLAKAMDNDRKESQTSITVMVGGGMP